MANFHYTAQSSAGSVVSGEVEASSRATALELIAKQKLKPLSIVEVKGGGKKFSFGSGRVKSKELVIFTRQLSTMVSAGVPLLRALTTLSEQAESATLKKALQAISKDVQSGSTLGDAFSKHPRVFSDVYINMVKAGEAGGILDSILKRLALQQEKNESIRKKVKGAMTYPMILMIITFGAFFGLMFFVVPTIGNILHDLGGPDAQLPALTQAMLSISDFMRDFWYIVIGVGVGGTIGIGRYLRTPRGKSQFHHLIIKLPAVGPIVSKVAVARFARTYASLMGAGVSVLESLRVTGDAIGNEAFRDALVTASEGVRNGKPLSGMLAENKLFPAIIPQMLAVGEETGQTGEVLEKVADFYEEEVDTAIGSISSVIEPVMIVIMGSMVGLIAASVMGPIASLSNSVK